MKVVMLRQTPLGVRVTYRNIWGNIKTRECFKSGTLWYWLDNSRPVYSINDTLLSKFKDSNIALYAIGE